jgi:ubiquinol-cytochrome c reductase cytochrome b subunit
LIRWLDDRTGIRKVVREALYERIPGGARWRYVWGSTLVFCFFVQAVTGIVLWMSYSPGGQSAWESVYYIQHHLTAGWFLRGLHHFTAQAMVILLVLHFMQVVIDGAYRAPREINFWLGLLLMQVVLGLSLTGYLLPWDQKGYWATRVATNLMGLLPGVGSQLQSLVVGGSDYGHGTLTRFFALHAGILPAALVGLLGLHVALFRRHGIKVKTPEKRPETTFWPDQVLKDAVACLAVLAVVVYFVVRPGLPAFLGGEGAEWSARHLGADLGAPADPSEPYSAARPEWYFLFLFQFLKLFEGPAEVWGAIYLPGIVMGVLFLMPLLGRWKLGHGFNVGLLAVLLLGVFFLTGRAIYDDRVAAWFERDKFQASEEQKKLYENSEQFLLASREAEQNATRVIDLLERKDEAGSPMLAPIEGAVALLRNDPFTQGPRLFAVHCGNCHSHAGGTGFELPAQNPSAPNLAGVGSRQWLSGIFDAARISGPDYFGATKHAEGQMAEFVKADFASLGAEEQDSLKKMIEALSAQAGLPGQAAADRADAERIAEGEKILSSEGEEGEPWILKESTGQYCMGCHTFSGKGTEGVGPDLTGYMSREWLIAFISNPEHARFYGPRDDSDSQGNDRMPAFAANPDSPQSNLLTRRQIEIIVDWLRGDYDRREVP